jgi:OPA family glycerol-3-phosphate transporter-like MFS transporter
MFTNRIIIVLAMAEFCTGFVRNGVMFWLPKLVKGAFKVDTVDKIKHFSMLNPAHWDAVTSYGVGLFLTGVVGGIIAGRLSDRLFQSRRGPMATIYYLGLCLSLGALALKHDTPAAVVAAGLAASFFFIGIHGLLSGTASMDFGGRKSAGTATGIIDGFVYLGSGLAGLPLGTLLDHTTKKLAYWPLMLLPIAVVGMVLTATLWNAHPARQRKAKLEPEVVDLPGAPAIPAKLIERALESDRPRPQA